MSRMRDLLIKRRSEVTPLIHWDFSGKSNADAGTIVEDLTGNGYDLELKNFAFDNKSGYNGYPTDFRNWEIINATGYDTSFPINITQNKLNFNGTIKVSSGYKRCGIVNSNNSIYPFITDNCVIKVTGFPEGKYFQFINQSTLPAIYVNLYNGINIVDTKDYGGSKTFDIIFDGNLNGIDTINATIEIFPLYPDQLVFNNNFAASSKPFKIDRMRGFTAIIRRKFIQENIRTVVLGQNGPEGEGISGSNFIIREYNADGGNNWTAYNLGRVNTTQKPSGDLMWTTFTKIFNGQINIISASRYDPSDIEPILLGSYTNTLGNGNFAIKEVYIFDRDLTQSQIEKFISDNMIPLPEVYYDVEKQGTLNEHTTKDKLIDFSGNENHGTLHNFTFDESNGWNEEGYIKFNANSGTYITLDTLTSGFKTVCILFAPETTGETHYDQRVVTEGSENPLAQTFAIYGEDSAPAWNARNSGITYINGVLNTSIFCTSLSSVKHSAIIVNNDVTEDNTTTPAIGKGFIATSQHYSNMKFYKFLGFKEVLSEKQIKMVIEKYGLQVD